MRRRRFLADSAAAIASLGCLRVPRARADSDADPASSAPQPSLRVLLGTGNPQPLATGIFEFRGRQYRGSYSRAPDGSVVNLVGLEEYLYSVVPREMPSSWPSQALQMQAICARTFVLQRSDPLQPYDVVPSQFNQVYEGIGTESQAGRAAVDSTDGVVLRYGSQYAQIAYSSCCGGHTESAADVWGGTPQPYLGGVACPYCNDSPDYRWTRDIPFAAVERAMSARLMGLGHLRDIRLGARDASGRVREVELITNRSSVVVRGSDFRIGVGPDLIRSLLIFTLVVQPPEGLLTQPLLHLKGGGNGHGVGLCQWGSRGIALAGGSVASIAAFYFPGTRIDGG